MTFLRETWYVAAFDHEVTKEPLGRKILNEAIMLYRKENGSVVALGDLCPHRFASMHQGKIINDEAQCPYHGLRFNSSGACVHNPHGNGHIPSNARLTSYAVTERYGLIWIWMGEKDNANPALIIDVDSLINKEPFDTVSGRLKVNANYQLIMDNLLDLSHVAFIHPHFAGDTGDISFGGQSKWEQDVKQNGNTVMAETAFLNIPVSSHFGNLWPNHPERGDVWGNITWYPPSNLLFDNGMRSLDETSSVATPSSHLLTPETDTTTHYFWRFSWNTILGQKEVQDAVWAGVNNAFVNEDEPMISSIQQNIGEGTDLMSMNPVLLHTDGSAIRARRVLAQLIDQQVK